MSTEELINYLIASLIGARTLAHHESEVNDLITHALSIFDEDTINKATIKVDMSTREECTALKEKFISSVMFRNHKNITGYRALDNGKFVWEVTDSEGNKSFKNTSELQDVR